MKKIIYIFLFLFFIFSNLTVSAQEKNLLFAITFYNTREDIDVLFNQSTRALGYFEDSNKSFFLSLISDKQKQELLKNNLNPTIIDINTDISRYTLLVNPVLNQSQKLAGLGEIFPISDHYTLLKSSPGKIFDPDSALEFNIVPFAKRIVPPPSRTKTVITPVPTLIITSIPTPTIARESTSSPKSGILILLTIIIMVIGVSAFFILKKTRSTNNPPKI